MVGKEGCLVWMNLGKENKGLTQRDRTGRKTPISVGLREIDVVEEGRLSCQVDARGGLGGGCVSGRRSCLRQAGVGNRAWNCTSCQLLMERASGLGPCCRIQTHTRGLSDQGELTARPGRMCTQNDQAEEVRKRPAPAAVTREGRGVVASRGSWRRADGDGRCRVPAVVGRGIGADGSRLTC